MRYLFFLLMVCLGSCASSISGECDKYIVNGNFSETENVFTSIENAQADMVSGDVVCLREGIYSGIKLNNIDGGEKYITVKPAPGNIVVLRNRKYKGAGIEISNSNNLIVSGFTIRNGLYGVYSVGSESLILRNLDISNIGQEGISVKVGTPSKQLSNISIQNNFISKTGKSKAQYGEGIYIGDGNKTSIGSLDRVSIYGNRIDDTSNEAIDIKVNAVNVVIKENIISNVSLLFNGAITVGTSAIVGESTEVLIESNLIYDVANISGYRPIGIALGHGNVKVLNNTVVEPNELFVGICLFTTFVNKLANNVKIVDNHVITEGLKIITKCGNGGTGVNEPANVVFSIK